MTNKIIEMFPSDSDEIEVLNSSVIEIMERCLKDAKDGKVVNCAIVMVEDDTSLSYVYSNRYLRGTLIGGMEIVKSRMLIDNEIET